MREAGAVQPTPTTSQDSGGAVDARVRPASPSFRKLDGHSAFVGTLLSWPSTFGRPLRPKMLQSLFVSLSGRPMERILSNEALRRTGQVVRLAGWVHNIRKFREVKFLILRDRGGLIQTVLAPHR